MMDICIEWAFQARGKKDRIERSLRASCKRFFSGSIVTGCTLKVLNVHGGNLEGGQEVRIAPESRTDSDYNSGGVHVLVRNEGKKYILGYLMVGGMQSEALRELITLGPLSRPASPRVATLDRVATKEEGRPRGESPDVHVVGQVVVNQSEDSDTSRQSSDPHELLRLFWEDTLKDCEGQIEGEYLTLTNEILTARAVRDLSMGPKPGEKISFYRSCVAPLGERIQVKGNKFWKFKVSTLQAFIKDGPLPKIKQKERTVREPKESLRGGQEPDAVLNELEELLRRIEVASLLQNELSDLQTAQGVDEGKLKELDAQIATTERALAELRGKRGALKQTLKKNNVRLEEVEALLARNAVSEEIKRRLQAMGVLKGTATGDENTVVQLFAQTVKP